MGGTTQVVERRRFVQKIDEMTFFCGWYNTGGGAWRCSKSMPTTRYVIYIAAECGAMGGLGDAFLLRCIVGTT